MVEGVVVYRVDSLDRAVRFLSGEISLTPLDSVAVRRGRLPSSSDRGNAVFADFFEIKGQHSLRRAVEVAASGFHNLLMMPPIPPHVPRAISTVGVTASIKRTAALAPRQRHAARTILRRQGPADQLEVLM